MAFSGNIELLLEGDPLTREDLRQLPDDAATSDKQDAMTALLEQIAENTALTALDGGGPTSGSSGELDGGTP